MLLLLWWLYLPQDKRILALTVFCVVMNWHFHHQYEPEIHLTRRTLGEFCICQTSFFLCTSHVLVGSFACMIIIFGWVGHEGILWWQLNSVIHFDWYHDSYPQQIWLKRSTFCFGHLHLIDDEPCCGAKKKKCFAGELDSFSANFNTKR